MQTVELAGSLHVELTADCSHRQQAGDGDGLQEK